MSEINSALQEAEILYKNGLYQEAATKCIEVIKTGECIKEAYLLWAKAYLFLIPMTMAEDNQYTKSLYDAILKSVSNAETIEEMFDIECELCSAVNEWEKYNLKKQLAFIVENPTPDNWREHINTWVTASKMRIYVQLNVVNSPAFNKLQENLGEDKKTLREKYGKESENAITDEEKQALYYSSGCEIFAQASALLEEYKHTSQEALMTVKDKMIGMLVLAPLVMQCGIKEGIPEELERLRQYANVLNYCINAQVFPNGKRIVLFKNEDTNANNDVNKLKKTYNRIKELDDTFVIPEIVVPQPTPVQTNNGGCYVATAVYGSYDCPQVWTLRRYRDDTLAETWYGRAFIKTYYAISPTLVKWFGHTEWFKKMWKGKLDRMVADLNADGVESTPYEDKNW